jgi:hypothetical protein
MLVYPKKFRYGCRSRLSSGKLVLKSSGGERAWFLKEESEPRNKLILLAGKNQRAEELDSLMKVKSTSHIQI